MPGFLFYPKGYEGGGHVRLCFSNISDADIERGVQILSEALEHSVE
jgi:DNA-binding transcriptional MocR family regulator